MRMSFLSNKLIYALFFILIMETLLSIDQSNHLWEKWVIHLLHFLIILFLFFHLYQKEKKDRKLIQKLMESEERYRSLSEYNHQLAYHDSLTGLPNCQLLTKQLEQSIQIKLNTELIAILCIDLDRFKIINESLGHQTGDLVLIEVATRLKEKLDHRATLSRQGGDEFTILLEQLENQTEVEHLADSILGSFKHPFIIEEREIFITPSIGISIYSNENIAPYILVQNAVSAMYLAKNKGKNNYQFYYAELEKRYTERLELETDLRRAIENYQFILHYQPQINIIDNRVIGMEALIRWNHPTKGIISPHSFISLAEETGIIIPIGEWVLKEACLQNKKWQQEGFPPFVMAVNISARQFYDIHFVQKVKTILTETKLEPSLLELEITESMLMDTTYTISILQELKKLGVKVSMDDFGKGYSSLAYLKRFPIDKLKIDQSFVRELLQDLSDATIVKTIIAMAHSLQLQVIAEGVETKEHLLFLQKHLCHEAQGYFFSKPIPADMVPSMLEELEHLLQFSALPQEVSQQLWDENMVKRAQCELSEAIRLHNGMIFKCKKQNGRFIYTLCDGDLLYRMGLSPENIVGKDIFDIFPDDDAALKQIYYDKVWNGEDKVSFEGQIGDTFYITTLTPIIRSGKISEIIGSSIDITEQKNRKILQDT
ncbi:putative bifunctional diguanylate cyclase/phosphodiesterase [Bacillus salitolerans]|uniref:Bifunctional diguanylate cyclase/phosphodiesterase n=1 Tax=Bacillus salitolerans TaxID=1437434 RepID=A0ABW4LVL7_9BACI